VLLNQRAAFPLAVRLRSPAGATLGEAFSFLSGLYFRGKLAYAERFSSPPDGTSGIQVITTDRGLLDARTDIVADDLRKFGAVDIDKDEPGYSIPLTRDTARLARHDNVEVVLLGSVATGKYVDILLDAFRERLLFPSDFVGRGDMSRGALLLQAVRRGVELAYQPVAGAIRRGPRAGRIGAR
jgi:hypothetical protein